MKRIAIVIGIVIIAGAAWFLASPLFFDVVVDEGFPSSATELREDEKAEIERMEALTPQEVDAMSDEERMEQKEKMEELGSKMPDVVADEPMDTEPQARFRGMFRDADDFHKGSGTATVYALADGNQVLRFEDFAVTNGPSLSVYLTKNADGSLDGGYLDLGKLKGNKGSQNYDLPEGTDLGAYKGVVIWCVPFGVTFSVATLE